MSRVTTSEVAAGVPDVAPSVVEDAPKPAPAKSAKSKEESAE